MSNPTNLWSLLRKRLSNCNDELDRVVTEASQVVIFGSRAVGVQNTTSDLDVFCVGSAEFKSKSLDVVVSTEATVMSKEWLQSELANHIACYGTWLRGIPDWSDSIRIGQQAILKKQHRIDAFLRCLPNSWERLQKCYKTKYAIKLRREAQRLILLERGVPVPPTVLLDSLWVTCSEGHERVLLKLQPTRRVEVSIVNFVETAPVAINLHTIGVDYINGHPEFRHSVDALLS